MTEGMKFSFPVHAEEPEYIAGTLVALVLNDMNTTTSGKGDLGVRTWMLEAVSQLKEVLDVPQSMEVSFFENSRFDGDAPFTVVTVYDSEGSGEDQVLWHTKVYHNDLRPWTGG